MNKYLLYILCCYCLLSLELQAQLNGNSVDRTVFNQMIDNILFEQNIGCNSSINAYSIPYIKQLFETTDTTLLSTISKDQFKWHYQKYAKDISGSSTNKLKINFNPILSTTSHIGKNSATEGVFGLDINTWFGQYWFGTIGYSHLFESDLLTDTAYLSFRDSREMSKCGSWYSGGDIRYCVGYFTDKFSLSFNNNRVRWGEGYHHTNIYSGNAPRFAKVSLRLKPTKWFEFNFYHGKLDPMLGAFVNDTVNANSSVSRHRKYIAANLFTFKPFSFWNFSVGNSIVYSQNSIKPVYFIPFMFYKSADHTYNGVRNDTGQNAQMFLTTSLKYAKWGRFYYSLFVDEITLSETFSKERNSNLTGFKIGTKLYHVLPNISAIIEYTHNRPMAYTHFIYATNFEHAGYNMGQSLEENANEWYFNLSWQKSARTNFYVEYYKQKKGPEFVNADNENRGHIFLETIEFENSVVNLGASYQISPKVMSFLNMRVSHPKGDISLLPDLLKEKSSIVSMGVRYGL